MVELNQIRRRSFLGFVGAFGAAELVGLRSTSVWASAKPAAPINIFNPEATYTLVFEKLIRERGYYKDFGVKPTTVDVSDGSKVLAGLLSGDGDICAGSGFAGLFPAIERGAKLKIIAGAIIKPDSCIYSKRSDIHSAKDLVGKTFGVGATGALLDEEAVALLIKKGIDYKTVQFVNVGSSLDVFKAVAAGTVDAGLGSIDFINDQKKYGVHVLSDGEMWKELPEFTDQAMFAPERAIAEKRDAIVRVLAAQARLFRFVSSPKSKEAWIKARAAALGNNDLKAALAQWEFFQSPGRLATGLVLTEANFNYIQKLNVLLGTQRNVLPFEDVADMSLARDALMLVGMDKSGA